MSQYKEKQLTIHLVEESGQEWCHRWFELRVDDVEISRGNTLLEMFSNASGVDRSSIIL